MRRSNPWRTEKFMTDKVLVRIDDDGNATVLMNRPEVHNAFDPDMVEGLSVAFDELGGMDGVRAVVLMGAGPSFSAGADIGHMKKSASFSRKQNYATALAMARMLYRLHSLKKPTIACVRGAVRGGGCGLVAACDIAIAARTATFRLSEVKLGIVPAMISPYVIAAMGARIAHRYMLTGEEFDAAEAYRIGFIHDICEEDDLVGKVGHMLSHLYTSGPNAIAAVKALIPLSANVPIDEEIVEETSRLIADIRATPEAQEGLSAFLEKRSAAWTKRPDAAPAPAARKGRGKS
jgi:methylglutaconyl-CoA hydratase